MACPKVVGVKNLTFSFTDCDAGTDGGTGNIRARTHSMAKDELPMYVVTNFTLEGLSAGRVKRTYQNAKLEAKVVRDERIPLSYYQGRASISFQCEHVNGIVYTGNDGFVTGVESSDSNEISLTIEYERIEELLPSGALAAA